MVSRQVVLHVRHPGKINGAGSGIGNRNQSLRDSGRKGVPGRNLDGFAGRTLYLHRSPGKFEHGDSFQHVAVPLVEERGGIDRMTRLFAVLTMNRERLCGSWYSRCERRHASLLSSWGGQ